MKMRTYLWEFYQSLYKAFRNYSRLQGTQTNPFDTVNSMQCPDQFQQAAVTVNAIRTQMDTGQHQFLKTIFCQSAGFQLYIFQFTASHPASGIWNNAITTELVASVLYFQKCTGMLGRMDDRQFFIFLLCMINIQHTFLFCAMVSFISRQHIKKILLFIISDNNINGCIRFCLLRRCLDITACCHHDRTRIHFFRLMDHLSGFAIRDIRHRTGIDNIHIRPVMERYNFISCLFQHLLHCLCLV